MNAKCCLQLCFDDEFQAEMIASSVRIDDEEFVTTRTEKNKIIAEISSSSILSMVQTLDDYLACVGVAARLTDKD